MAVRARRALLRGRSVDAGKHEVFDAVLLLVFSLHLHLRQVQHPACEQRRLRLPRDKSTTTHNVSFASGRGDAVVAAAAEVVLIMVLIMVMVLVVVFRALGVSVACVLESQP